MSARGWVAFGVAFGIIVGAAIYRPQYQREVARANQYDRDLAVCRYVVAACWRGEDLSGLTDSARASCGLPASKPETGGK